MNSTNTPTTPILSEQGKKKTSVIHAAGWSLLGINHKKNEDSFCIYPNEHHPLFCGVADGVGGGSFGEVASQTLVDYCCHVEREVLLDNQRFSDWFKHADVVVGERLSQISNRPGASTFVGIWFVEKNIIKSIHVGDCRLYVQPQNGPLKQLTLDQTYARFQITPPQGGSHDDPARMVGVRAIGTPEINQHQLNAGDTLILCSDGLHKFLDEQQLVQLIQNAQNSGISLESCCQQLVHAAKNAGSHDDISVVLVRYTPTSKLIWIISIILLLVLLIAGAWFYINAR